MLMGECGVGVWRAPRACRAAYQTPFIIQNQGSRCGFNYMQCSPDSLSLLANAIRAVVRFPLIFHFSSKLPLLRSLFHFAEQSICIFFHCPFIFPAALFPCVSSQWQINRLQTKEIVCSKKNQYHIFSLACNWFARITAGVAQSCAIKFYEAGRRSHHVFTEQKKIFMESKTRVERTHKCIFIFPQYS